MMLFNNVVQSATKFFTVQPQNDFLLVDMNGQDYSNIFWRLKNETGLFVLSLLMKTCLVLAAIGFLWLVFGQGMTAWHFGRLVYMLGGLAPLRFLIKAYFRPQFSDAEMQFAVLSYVYLGIMVVYGAFSLADYLNLVDCIMGRP